MSDRIEPARFESGRPMLLGGIRRRYSFDESAPGITAQWKEFEPRLPLPGQVGAITYGVMCGADAGGFEYLCAVEVASFASLPADLGRIRILAQRYAVFPHAGHTSTIRVTWERILNEWLPGSGFESAHKPDFEVYGPQFDPRTGLGGLEIWIAIVPRTDGLESAGN